MNNTRTRTRITQQVLAFHSNKRKSDFAISALRTSLRRAAHRPGEADPGTQRALQAIFTFCGLRLDGFAMYGKQDRIELENE